jgi:8-oxo-dGTP pyrophosphatase MutT (NUDIX family)
MVCRKHSISLIEFLLKMVGRRGNQWDAHALITAFERMTQTERSVIAAELATGRVPSMIFNNILRRFDLLLYAEKYCNYSQAISYFSTLVKGVALYGRQKNLLPGDVLSVATLLENTVCPYDCPEWGFPKGRRNGRSDHHHGDQTCVRREDDVACAKREFEEETNIPPGDYSIIDFLLPVSENYIASNQINYQAIYYVARYTGSALPKEQNSHQYGEISAVEWFSLDECRSRIRDYYQPKVRMVQCVKARLEKFI